MPNVPVTLHLTLRGTTRFLAAQTDAQGNFTTTFTPLRSEAGFYEVGADHPGEATTAVQDDFSILGFQARPAFVQVRLTEQSSVNGAVSLENSGELPLSDLTATILSQPANLSVNLSVGNGGALAGHASIQLDYSITANDATIPAGIVTVRITSQEGVAVEVPFYVAVQALLPQFVVLSETLSAGVTRGQQKVVEFDLINFGGATSGPVTVSLPPIAWLRMANTNPLPALPPGQTNRVGLLLTPSETEPFALHEGTLVVQSDTASLAVPFEFRVLSAALGDLQLSVEDEYTYYAEGSPKVADATVAVTDSLTRTLVATGVTEAQGVVLITNLPEAYYDLEVKAAEHGAYRRTLLLGAGRTNAVTAFLPRQAVSYSWSVVPTEIEDRTRIVLETKFESFVPMPVITVEPASVDLATLTDEVTQINFTISNHGLVAAESGRLHFGEHPLWEITPLTDDVGQVPAMGSVIVPVTFRKVLPGSPAAVPTVTAAGDSQVDPCSLPGSFAYQLICGIHFNTYQSPIALFNAANCSPVPLPTYTPPPLPAGGVNLSVPHIPVPRQLYEFLSQPVAGGSLPQPPFDPLAWAASPTPITEEISYYANVAAPTLVSNLCEPCTFKTLLGIGSCLKNIALPTGNIVFCVTGVPGCVTSLNFQKCVNSTLTCITAAGTASGVGAAVAAVRCANNILGACTESGAAQPADMTAVDGIVSVAGGPVSRAEVQMHAQRLNDILAPFQSLFGEEVWLEHTEDPDWAAWLTAFSARAEEISDGGIQIAAGERSELLAMPYPEGLTVAHLERFMDRWNRTQDYEARGIVNLADVPAGESTDFIALNVTSNAVQAAQDALAANDAEGLTNLVQGLQLAIAHLEEELNQGGGGGVCGKVSLRLDQQAVVSRDAFNATLEVVNESAHSLEQLFAQIVVMDSDGQDVSDRFGIRPPTLENLSAADGTGAIASGTTARLTWTIVPSAEAAPQEPVFYYVSGLLAYVQDGLPVGMPLSAVPIEVHPTPRLFVKYFHERNVYGDDPFTDIVEPSVPFSLGVMVENRGQGVAKNMRITSGQPQIVENEKGLRVDFNLIATEVAGQNQNPSLTVSFGDILPLDIVQARWLMTASLQGLFTEYQAAFEHLDALGNRKLSLIEEVTIHETIHLVDAPGTFADGRPDFLVNDVPDPADYPDTLYLSDGSTNPVIVVEQLQVVSSNQFVLEVTAPMPMGWAYLHVPEPTDGQWILRRIVRSDGREISLGTNAWTTDRTFIGLGKRPVSENILHLLDHDSPGSYTLTYALPPAPDTDAPVSTVAALPVASYSQFTVNWSGDDEPGGSGLAFFDVYVSRDGGAFLPWLQRTTARVATFAGTQGSHYAFYSAATDAAGNREATPIAPQAETTVALTNTPPSLQIALEVSLDEGQTLLLTNRVTDVDVPAQALSFRLGSVIPPGAILNPASGTIHWPTSEATGPGTNLLVLIVTDTGSPPLSSTGQVTVIVREVNEPPVLAAIEGATINEGEMLSVTNRATDPDVPANPLTFHLESPAPAGAMVDPANGIFQWRPAEYQGPSTNVLTVTVTDHGDPSLSATQQFTVVVRDILSDFTVSLGSTNLFVGETNSVPVWLRSSLDLSNIVIQVGTLQERLANLAWRSSSAEINAAIVQPAGSNLFVIQLTLNPDLALAGDRQLGDLSFVAVSNEHSAIVPLKVANLFATRANGQTMPNGAGHHGRVIVVGREPVLRITPGAPPVVTLYGRPGQRYTIEGATSLLGDAAWQPMTSFLLPSRWADVRPDEWTAPMTFYRAYESAPENLRLSAYQADGPVFRLQVLGVDGVHYVVQTTTNLGDTNSWLPAFDLVLTNTTHLLNWTNANEPGRFFRVMQPE